MFIWSYLKALDLHSAFELRANYTEMMTMSQQEASEKIYLVNQVQEKKEWSQRFCGPYLCLLHQTVLKHCTHLQTLLPSMRFKKKISNSPCSPVHAILCSCYYFMDFGGYLFLRDKKGKWLCCLYLERKNSYKQLLELYIWGEREGDIRKGRTEKNMRDQEDQVGEK